MEVVWSDVTDVTLRDVVVPTLKYGLGFAALAWLLGGTDLGRVRTLLFTVEPTTVLALLVVTLAGLLARFATWYVLVAPVTRVGLGEVAAIDLVVNFVNQLLPSRLSGRVAAPFVVRSHTGMAYADAAAVSAAHTALYAILYGLAAVAGLAVAAGRLPVELAVLLAVSTGLYLLAGTVVLVAGLNLPLLEALVSPLASIGRRVPGIGQTVAARVQRLPAFLSASTDAFAALVTSPGVWLQYSIGWAGALLLAPGLRAWLLLGAFGGSVEPTVLLPFYLVAAYSVTLLPLTPGGIGITEVTATAVFVALGVPAHVIVPVVFVDRVLGVYLPALAGWYPSLRLDVASLSTE